MGDGLVEGRDSCAG
uniref:Uncharacterized protein n=1 Tax=Arundo donax TaxID=35708 RepID=A0A0A8XQ68_ARUDO